MCCFIFAHSLLHFAIVPITLCIYYLIFIYKYNLFVNSCDNNHYDKTHNQTNKQTNSTHPPPDLTTMRCLSTPAQGGETLFASSVKAAQLLPTSTLQSTYGIHPDEVRVNYKLFDKYAIAPEGTHLLRAEGSKGETEEGGWDVNLKEGTSVPLVIKERNSGNKSMVGTYHVASISHLNDPLDAPPRLGFEEANRYVAEAWKPGLQEEHVYKHQWKVGDLAMWSNRLVIHTATSTKYYEGEERLHTRIRMRAREEDSPSAWKFFIEN